MNESLKIGLGILLGFLLLGALVVLSLGLNSQKIEIVDMDHAVLEYIPASRVYVSHINSRGDLAKQEVFLWLKNEKGLGLQEICDDAIVVFIFSKDINEQEKNVFNPQFSECSL